MGKPGSNSTSTSISLSDPKSLPMTDPKREREPPDVVLAAEEPYLRRVEEYSGSSLLRLHRTQSYPLLGPVTTSQQARTFPSITRSFVMFA